MSKYIYITLAVLVIMLCPVKTVAQGQPNHSDTPQRHLQLGCELFDASNYRGAQVELQKALELTPVEVTGQRMRIDYMLAECAARLGATNAKVLLDAFMLDYPNSIYSNDVCFEMANLLYDEGDYQSALSEYIKVDAFSLQTAQMDEYNFKMGHSYFMMDDLESASKAFRQSAPRGIYAPHVNYHIAYIDYINGKYASAKRGFSELLENASYQEIIPFYLLQIEFLENNYDYVVREGAVLVDRVKGERESEIARVVSESWFHKGDYAKTLDYMERYRSSGGSMGRTENYLLGYSLYMRNDIDAAVVAFNKVVGPDDKLTQNAAHHLGGCYLKKGDKLRAMQSFSMASGADYDDEIREDALFNYGKLQYELGGGVFNEAINVLNRYISEYPKSERIDQAREYLIAAYYNSKSYQAAYDAIKLMVAPDNNIRTAFQKIAYFRALEQYSAGDYDRAQSTLEESLASKFNPKYTALTYFWMGEITFGKGQYNEAAAQYKEYVTLSPSTSEEYGMALYNIAYCHFNQEQWADARTWFNKFLTTDKRAEAKFRADAYNRLGDAQYVNRDFKNALANYDAASRLGTPERYHSLYQYAVTLGLTSGNARKTEALQKIISTNEGEYVDDAMYELGRTYITMDRFSDGATTLKRLIAEYPESDKNLEALSDLGLAYQNMDNNKMALQYYKTLIDKAPNSTQARDAMTAVKSIYMDMNDIDGYFDFAGSAGMETDMGVVARDSLSFAAVERTYMTSSSKSTIISSLKGYLDKFPRGAYRANVLSFLADSYVADKQPEAAIESLKELSAMHYNSFTVKGLESLAQLSYEQKQYTDAANAYKKLITTAVNPETTARAWEGYMKTAKMEQESAKLVMIGEIISGSGVPAAVVRDAKFTKANIMTQRGDGASALAIYRELASESRSEQGAASTYHVIQSLYDSGNLTGAERMILDFAKQNTPHSYWLGKAFLTLGNIYVKNGDTFQARATLQSIVDGYSPADDGIIDSAKKQIGLLK